MAKKSPSISVKDTVHKLQLSLLDGIKTEHQLFAAGSIISRKDYEDVVTERYIAKICGYPLCPNQLPSERARKGRYRISLKEHKVYDLNETNMYCSSKCVVNSRAFSGSLYEERCKVVSKRKFDEVMRLFEELKMESEGLEKDGDLGLSKLVIRENLVKGGDVSMEDWVGPSDAIEGYVPRRDRQLKHPPRRDRGKEGVDASEKNIRNNKDLIFHEMDFMSMSTIITSDEYSVSKPGSLVNDTSSPTILELPKGKDTNMVIGDKFARLEISSKHSPNNLKTKLQLDEKSRTTMKDEFSTVEVPERSKPCQTDFIENTQAGGGSYDEEAKRSLETMLKSSLKTSGSKKLGHSVTWADQDSVNARSRNLCEVGEMEDVKAGSVVSASANSSGSSNADADEEDVLRFASAEACAMALTKAAEAVASGETDVTDAVSEAGITILPHKHDADERELSEDADILEPEPVPVKWPTKPGTAHSDLLDSDSSWFDGPPEGFSMDLSPFATMWMALFEWITSSTMAYVYGRDESFHDEYQMINGREYPQKVFLDDGRSSEIRQTIDCCLARASPDVVLVLKLPIPVSVLEKGMGYLLDTMSFMKASPPLHMNQWKVVVLLLLEALSVCRMPLLMSHMTNSRILFHKVLDGTVTAEEYELMKDIMIPLGKAPTFSSQSGA